MFLYSKRELASATSESWSSILEKTVMLLISTHTAPAERHLVFTASSASWFLPTRASLVPSVARWAAAPAPIPELAPVMRRTLLEREETLATLPAMLTDYFNKCDSPSLLSCSGVNNVLYSSQAAVTETGKNRNTELWLWLWL